MGKKRFDWLIEGWLYWLGPIVPFAASFSCFRGDEPTIRLVGLCLQCLGMLTTAYGIVQTRLFFNQPNIVQSAKAWFRRFPLRRSSAIVGQQFVGTVKISFGAGRVTVTAGQDAPLELRIKVLEENLDSLTKHVAESERNTAQRIDKLSAAFDEEKQTRTIEHQRIQERLKEVQTGGLGMTTVGLVWLFVGAVLSTASNELARYAPWLLP